MTSEMIDVIMAVIRKSRHLQVLQLKNCALPRDFITLFASALQQNPTIPLEALDLSKNVLDDKKGFVLLSGVLPRLTSLRQVNFSECGLSEKCSQLFCSGIYSALTAKSNSGAIPSLTELNFSTNVLKDDVSSLVNVVSLCTTLRVLDLTDTGFPLDKIWAALKYGGLQIEKLYLGGCYAGKKAAECAQQVKEFFSMAVNLSVINFVNTILPAELMKAMLLGLASNQQLKPFHLDISGTCEKNCSAVLEACLGGVQCNSISLRDNNLETEMQAVIHALGNIKTLRRVDLGGANLLALRRSSKQAHAAVINKTILDLVKLFSDDSCLEELILSDARLGPHLSVLLNTLGATTSLRLLDISNNDLGHFGARILSKALQLNVSLRTVVIDNNHLGVEGLSDIATALSMNKTLTQIPYPVQDVCECLGRAGCDRARLLSAMTQMESYLERNRSPANSDFANFRINTMACFSAKCHQSEYIILSSFQGVDPGSLEKWDGFGDILNSTIEEAFPHRLEDMVEDFVEQVSLSSINSVELIFTLRTYETEPCAFTEPQANIDRDSF
ncbi:leucine Rich repeat-containing domain protein [Cooperia oncophora]